MFIVDKDLLLKQMDVIRTSVDEKGNTLLPAQMNALVLAYVGDTVYDLYVRTKLILSSDATANMLHRKAIDFVCASAQAEAADRAMEYFTEDEMAIYKRGRNSKHATVPKNADLGRYHKATGLESVLGYLYLDGKVDRLTDILKICIDKCEGI